MGGVRSRKGCGNGGSWDGGDLGTWGKKGLEYRGAHNRVSGTRGMERMWGGGRERIWDGEGRGDVGGRGHGGLGL